MSHCLRYTCRARSIAQLACMGICTALIGCGAGQGENIVSGNVTYDGAPLATGQVVFEPRGAGKMSIAQIKEGSYQLPAGFGLLAGDYVVRITSMRPTGQKVQPAVYSEDQTPADVFEQFLPAKYNQSSELHVTVDPASELTHNFTLSSK